MNTLNILKGTQKNYDALSTKDPNTIYFTIDTHRIYIGNEEFSRPTECVNDLQFITPSNNNALTVIQKQ